MEEPWPATMPTDDPAAMDAAFLGMFAEMEQIDERIRRSQQEIEGLKAETRAMLKVLKAD
jgi:hypothetical protein